MLPCSLIDISTCICKKCDIEIFPNFYIQNKRKIITNESIKHDKFVYISGNQIFDQNLLLDFDHHLVKNTMPFDGYTSAYNSKIAVVRERQDKQITNTTSTNYEL